MRIQKVGENGREIVLYRIAPGDICIVTTACLMSDLDYDAEGVAETDIEAQALPIAGFRELLAKSASFREFVFKTYGTRISTLLLLIEEVAFGRIDQRLASCLLKRARGGAEVKATHQELAVELRTAREVVSRQLKEFERRGWTASRAAAESCCSIAPLWALFRRFKRSLVTRSRAGGERRPRVTSSDTRGRRRAPLLSKLVPP